MKGVEMYMAVENQGFTDYDGARRFLVTFDFGFSYSHVEYLPPDSDSGCAKPPADFLPTTASRCASEPSQIARSL